MTCPAFPLVGGPWQTEQGIGPQGGCGGASCVDSRAASLGGPGRVVRKPPCPSLKVEALQGHRVVDVACGSGDAQTLCLTDDDTVWSWGDGDYGKLGRGGSDGCKVPMKVPLSPRVGRPSTLPPSCPCVGVG